MDESITRLGEEVTISVERMMKFCYIVQMEHDYVHSKTRVFQTHLTRFGTMVFMTASFLFSLFDDTKNSTNLHKVWRGFDHPFDDELRAFVVKLEPFNDELRKVRNRIGFHGSTNRSHEKAGLGIFDIESGRGREFARLIRDMQNLALKMIRSYIEGMNESAHPHEILQEFMVELQGHPHSAPQARQAPKK
jgi:hypothetical protein